MRPGTGDSRATGAPGRLRRPRPRAEPRAPAARLNQGFEARIGQALPLMPGAARLLAELSEYEI
ncbi:hypothetical protein ABT065_32360, partial [Streptomyces sp. NPDC002764]